MLGLVPGLSWASGTSRPRYFQIRGIGEIEQYQGAPNPSVGFLIDDIDFSGVGMPATLFDLDHIEVLRGPGSTVYGANALAGLISLRSRDPGTGFDLSGEATAGDFGTEAVGLAVGDGRADGSGGWRLAAQRYRSDGFRQNVFLGRRDTNGYDETTLRGKLVWSPWAALHASLTLLYADLDNGYDAWSVDNSFTTRSNQPGRDAQRSTGASLRLEYTTERGRLVSVSSAAVSHIVYSFDGDWGNDVFWGVNAPYDYFEEHRRARRTQAQDLRFIGDEAHLWFGRLQPVVGVYLLRLQESDAQFDGWNDQYNGAGQSLLDSDYRATNLGRSTVRCRCASRGAALTLGLRAENRSADYTTAPIRRFRAPATSCSAGTFPLWRASVCGSTTPWHAATRRRGSTSGHH
jgi:outer membrane receptor protein involved in Fe transport